ncbi:hypothetical protein [Nostoc sp.]|uniref:hypothetical protein n=1 Tax=Nostoc sp. TaxID=1180 RepID=UPI003FA5A51C
MTQAHINMPELQNALDKGCLQIDGKIPKSVGITVASTGQNVSPEWKIWASKN